MAAGLVFAIGDAAVGGNDPVVTLGSLSAAALALATLLVKDRIAMAAQPQQPPDLVDRIERLATSFESDRSTSASWRTELRETLVEMDGRVKAIEIGVASLRSHQEIIEDESEIATWRSNPDGQCVWASKALREMTGYTFEDGFQGTNWTNVFPPADVPTVSARWAEAVRMKSPFNMRTNYRHASGAVFAVHLHAAVLPDGSFRGVARKI